LLNLLQLIGWGAFEIIVMRDAASLLGARAFSDASLLASPMLWTLFSVAWRPCWRSVAR